MIFAPHRPGRPGSTAEHVYTGILPDHTGKKRFWAYGQDLKPLEVLCRPDRKSLRKAAARIWEKHRLRLKADGKYIPVDGQPDNPDFTPVEMPVPVMRRIPSTCKPVVYEGKLYISVKEFCRIHHRSETTGRAMIQRGDLRLATKEDIENYEQGAL